MTDTQTAPQAEPQADQPQTYGVKETLEILEAMKITSVAIRQVTKDGKVNLSDIPTLVGMISQFSAYTAAIADAPIALKEIADLDETEAKQVVSKVYEILKAVKEA